MREELRSRKTGHALVNFGRRSLVNFRRPLTLRGSDLIYMTTRLLAVLEVLLLQGIGFPSGSLPYTVVLERRISWLPKSVSTDPDN